ncbi:P27 family phage terminase small subunit [Nafulsella turpanensis]|uniref:P27 family phage terminase small subunit n=1 Tax=Nafulsella turpanensis TaxID=1265690 RepID=UPI000349DC8F|nr:P27 family phage terminase small subunit [Nafulsella turpanensis]
MSSKKAIVQYLEEKGTYTPAYDFHIELLLHQLKLYRQAKKLLNEEGLSVAGNAEGTFLVRNQHLKTLTECIHNIKTLSRSLGLSVADSIIFKELNGDAQEDDGFDELE